MSQRLRRQRALTLIEMMVSLAIFSVIALAAMSFIVSSLRVNYYVEAQTDASNMGQQALDEMRGSLAQSKKLLDVTTDFLALIDLSSAPELAGELRLPKIEPAGSISPRAGSKDGVFNKSSVGNALLYVEALSPFQEPSTKRLIDRYRFVLYYVAKAEGRIAHVPYVLDLVRVESVEYADFTQIDALNEDMERTVVAALEKKGITYAWDPGAPAIAAFSRLSNARLVVPPEPKHRIAPARIATAIPGVGRSQRGSGVIAYSVAFNDGEVPVRSTVPKYGQPAEGFPNGFEVLVTGPGHGRKVFVRLVVAAEAQGRFFSREHQMLAAVWD